MPKCAVCHKNIGFWRDFFTSSLCDLCLKERQKKELHEEIERKNKEQGENFIKAIQDQIDKIEVLRQQSQIDKRAKKEFENGFENIINSIYGVIYRSIISSLESTIWKSNKNGLVQDDELNIFTNFINNWKINNDIENIIVSKEVYNIFKRDIKLKKEKLGRLIKILETLEKSIRVDEAVQMINDYIEMVEEEKIQEKLEQMKKINKERKIREEAEKRLYGDIKVKRQVFTNNEKDMIFQKFENKCAICGKEEGLHIHHKDQNPKNNQIDNLILLCGVCHKKIHMRVR